MENRRISATEERKLANNTFAVAPGVWRLKDIFVNIFIIQNKDGAGWVLVDTGLPSSAGKIKKFAATLFGSAGSTPEAIILTHGHFDHRGSLIELAEQWGAPVYCHHQEMPFLTGIANYPPADPSVGGGMMATLSFTFPTAPIDATAYLTELPADGTVPGLDEWRWLHTPGHAPGHVSLYREDDGVLIAGDAFVTTMQESVIAVATQAKIICGPPKYFTPDWGAAARSVRALSALQPQVLVTGHGQAFYGDVGRKALHKLSREFWRKGIPAAGRYVKEAATFDENGIPTSIPPRHGTMVKRVLTAAALLAIGYLVFRQRKNGGFAERALSGKLGKTLMLGAVEALGASGPAVAAVPSIPLVPAL